MTNKLTEGGLEAAEERKGKGVGCPLFHAEDIARVKQGRPRDDQLLHCGWPRSRRAGW